MEEAVDSRDAVGASCSDAYVPLQDDDKVSEFALDGLKQVMAVKSRVVLPYLVPKVHFHMQHMPKLGPPVCAVSGLARCAGAGPWEAVVVDSC